MRLTRFLASLSVCSLAVAFASGCGGRAAAERTTAGPAHAARRAAAVEREVARHVARGVRALGGGDLDAAAAELAAATAIDDDPVAADLLKKVRASRQAAQASALGAAARRSAEARDWPLAAVQLRSALALDPDNPELRARLQQMQPGPGDPPATSASAAAVALAPAHRTPAPVPDPSGRPLNGRELYATRVESVVTVRTNVTLASGVVVGRGLVLTNAHVLKEPTGTIITSTGDRIPFEQSWVHPFTDVALILVDGLPLRPAPVGRGRALRPGDGVSVIGNPEGLTFSFSEGVIAALGRAMDPGMGDLLQFTAPISVGSSGCPLFDHDGRVVAVASMFLNEGQLLNFAVPIEDAVDLIRQLGLGDRLV